MINKTQHTNNSMQLPNTEYIEREIQYPQYKFVVITMLMSICGMLGTFYVFSIQEKRQFTKFKKEVQVAKQLQITDMQDRIQSYAKLHNSENLQSALPVLFSNHTKLNLKGEIELQENTIATQFQEQHLELYVLDGDFYVQADEQKDLLVLPILLQELQELGLWIYGIQFMDEEEFKKENQVAENQLPFTESSNDDSTKKKSVKTSTKKNKKQNPQILKISFEYPLPKWNTPTIFSEEEFVQQSFEVLAFLAYWEKFKNISQDEKLIIQINDHLHEMMWNSTNENNINKNKERTFRRHKIFDQNLLTQHGVLIESSGLTDKVTESNPSQIQ